MKSEDIRPPNPHFAMFCDTFLLWYVIWGFWFSACYIAPSCTYVSWQKQGRVFQIPWAKLQLILQNVKGDTRKSLI